MGFSSEYFFDEHFNWGGEFGIRLISISDELSYETTFLNPNTGLDQATTLVEKANFRISPTYTKISPNFHF
jgi:hypothetical protein